MKLNLITYGLGNELNHELIDPVKNAYCKPAGGLWASPIHSKYGWFDWCKENKYGDLSTSFQFYFEGNPYIINSVKDLIACPKVKIRRFFTFIDFEKLLSIGYDAVWLTVKGEKETRFSEPVDLYGWDCESVFIMNKERIMECVK